CPGHTVSTGVTRGFADKRGSFRASYRNPYDVKKMNCETYIIRKRSQNLHICFVSNMLAAYWTEYSTVHETLALQSLDWKKISEQQHRQQQQQQQQFSQRQQSFPQQPLQGHVCKDCGKIYKQRNALWRHFKYDEYRCCFCNSPYPTTSHLKSHLTRGCFMDPTFSIENRRSLNKMESRNYVCPKCSQGYKNKRTLDTHLRIACGREPKFQCPYCDLKSKHPPNIYTHIRRKHKGEDLFLIINNTKFYILKQDDKEQMNVNERNSKKNQKLIEDAIFILIFVKFYSNVENYLQIHALSNHTNQTIVEKFSFVQNVKKSLIIEQVFVDIGNIVEELELSANNSTRGEGTKRKYSCKYCGKGFTQSGHLRSHQKSSCYWNPRSTCHQSQKIRPFSCTQCGACYSKQSHLIFHVRHECGRTQKCNVCGKTFLHSSSLRRHRQRAPCNFQLC
ncbi:hypothetical protein ALC56_13429, partial [Trachymyrmex septentrionalis]